MHISACTWGDKFATAACPLPLRRHLPLADFAADLAALFPDGVDVVLNSLTSPGMLAASLAVLKRGGTFVEVGKRDIWAAARVAQVRVRGAAVQLARNCAGVGACTQSTPASVMLHWPT